MEKIAGGESKFTQTKDFSQFGKGKWRERVWATEGAATKTKPGGTNQREYVFATNDGTAALPRKRNCSDYELISLPPSQSSLPAELPPTGRQQATWDTV